MMANIQSILYLTKRIADLNFKGQATIGMAGLSKSWCTSKGRVTLALVREMLGAIGILNEN